MGQPCISDRFFSSALGPTFLNRLYLYAATSFGHVDSSSLGLYPHHQPKTGTIFNLLDNHGIDWRNYGSGEYVANLYDRNSPHFSAIGFSSDISPGTFYGDNASGHLPPVVFIDTGDFDEHSPKNIQAGQYYVSQIVDAIRHGPYWRDSVVIINYDEHGGYYDHVAPPVVIAPDSILPGKCEDTSHPYGSSDCADTDCCNSEYQSLIMQSLRIDPLEVEARYDKLGFRVPFIVVSPFAKNSYVSHIDRDHTSILAFIEMRFLNNEHLTARDAAADPLSDLFDFNNRPSLLSEVSGELAPIVTNPHHCH